MNDVIFKKKSSDSVAVQPQAKSEAAEASASDKVCPDCGAPIAEGSKFCTKCGKQL